MYRWHVVLWCSAVSRANEPAKAWDDPWDHHVSRRDILRVLARVISSAATPRSVNRQPATLVRRALLPHGLSHAPPASGSSWVLLRLA